MKVDPIYVQPKLKPSITGFNISLTKRDAENIYQYASTGMLGWAITGSSTAYDLIKMIKEAYEEHEASPEAGA